MRAKIVIIVNTAPKKKVFNSREVIVDPMKIVVRGWPEQHKDDSEPAFGPRKAPDEFTQGAEAQRRLFVTVDVLGDEPTGSGEDQAVLEDVRLRNLPKQSARRFEHQRTARGPDAATVGVPDD